MKSSLFALVVGLGLLGVAQSAHAMSFFSREDIYIANPSTSKSVTCRQLWDNSDEYFENLGGGGDLGFIERQAVKGNFSESCYDSIVKKAHAITEKLRSEQAVNDLRPPTE